MDQHEERLKALQETLKAAAESNSNAIIPPKQAGEDAEALDELMKRPVPEDASA